MTILKKLSEAVGVSGKEDAVRKIVLEAIEGHAENIRIDPMGSVTAIKKGTGDGLPRVMLAAHMDEIGFMVIGFDGSGLIRFQNVGGVDSRILPGLRVIIGEDAVRGVIIHPPIHLNGDKSVKQVGSMRIDIGASSKDAANGKVSIGDRITFDSQFMEIGDTMLRGKALDDRAGCALLIDVLQGGPYPVDVLAAFTVQEEIGLRGATVAAHSLKPDIGFALETTPSHDLPNAAGDRDDPDDANPACRLGDGPVLPVIDSRTITDPRILNFLRTTAEQNNLPYQLKTRRGGGTDAGAIHISEAGVPSGSISVPCRYIHGPAAMMNRQDYDHTLALIQAALNGITSDLLEPYTGQVS